MTSTQTLARADLTGIGTVFIGAETSTGTVAQAFDTYVTNIYAAFNTTNPPDVAALSSNMQNLLNIAINGVPDYPGAPTKSFMNAQMVTVVNEINQTLLNAGIVITPSSSNLTQQLMTSWQASGAALSIFAPLPVPAGTATPVPIILQDKEIAKATIYSIQSMLQLGYIAAGNDLLNNQMTSLQTQMQTVNAAINNLNNIQSLHNLLSAPPPRNADSAIQRTVDPVTGQVTITSNPIPPMLSGDNGQNYNLIASQAFGGPLPPLVTASDLDQFVGNLHPDSAGSLTTFCQNALLPLTSNQMKLQQYSQSLQNQINTLNAVNPVVPPATFADSLQGQLTTCLDDINTYMNPPTDPNTGIPTNAAAQGFVNVTDPTGTKVYGWEYDTTKSPIQWTFRSFTLAEVAQLQRITDQNGQPTGVAFSDSVPSYSLPIPGADPNDFVTATTVVLGLPRASAFGWIMDSQDATQNQVTQSGNIQQNINNATTGATNLNSVSQQNLQRFLFVFQQFYQSASTMLGALNQIIQQITQGFAK